MAPGPSIEHSTMRTLGRGGLGRVCSAARSPWADDDGTLSDAPSETRARVSWTSPSRPTRTPSARPPPGSTPRNRTASGCARPRRPASIRRCGTRVVAMGLPDDGAARGARRRGRLAHRPRRRASRSTAPTSGRCRSSRPVVAARLLRRAVGGRPTCWRDRRGRARRAGAATGRRAARADLVPGRAAAASRRGRARRRPSSSSAAGPAATSRGARCRAWPIADVDLDRRRVVLAEGPAAVAAFDARARRVAGPHRRRRRPAWPAPPSTSACSTPRTATSSACRSAASRPSSTASPTSTPRVDGARLLAYEAVWALDEGEPDGAGAGRAGRRGGAARWPSEAAGVQPPRARRLRLHARVRHPAATSGGPRPPGSLLGDPRRRARSAIAAPPLGRRAGRRPRRRPPPRRPAAAWTSASSPETEAFRAEVRAFIAEHLDRRDRRAGPRHRHDARLGLPPGAVRAGLPRRRLADRGRRARAAAPSTSDRPAAGAVRRRRAGRRHGHRHHGRRHPPAAAAPTSSRPRSCRGILAGEVAVLPRLQRARRRQRRRRRRHPGRARRRRAG